MTPQHTKVVTMKSVSHLQVCLNAGIDQNDVPAVKSLARYHGELVDLNQWNEKGLSPLHQCCIHGNKTLLSVLLQSGADVNCVDPNGWTPLHTSSALGNYDFVVHLIKKGANVMAKTSTRELSIDLSLNVQIVLHLGTAMQKLGYGELANFYIKKLGDMETANLTEAEKRVRKRRSFSKQTRKEARPHSILKNRDSILINDGLTIRNYSKRDSFTVNCFGSSSDDEEQSPKMSPQPNNRFSVHFSAENLITDYVHGNEYEKLEDILKNVGTHAIDKLDRKGLSPLHWASIKGFSDCIKILAKYGADVDIRDPFGWTPLHAAVVSNHVTCIEVLLKLHVDIYALTQNGQSVFDWKTGEDISLLLQKHVEDDITTKELKSTDI